MFSLWSPLSLSFILMELVVGETPQTCRPQTVLEWSQLTYTSTNTISTTMNHNTIKGREIRENNIPGTIRKYEDYLYISVPRWKNGVVSTLNRVRLHPNLGLSPALEPFPTLRANQEGDCSALQNVDAIEIDPTGRLWVTDSGVVAPFSNPNRTCQPKLIIFQLSDGKEISRHELPPAVQNNIFYKQIVVDLSDGEEKARAYISEGGVGGIVVFELETEKTFTISSDQTLPVNNVFGIGSLQPFHLRFGVYGMALLQDRLVFSSITGDIYELNLEDVRRNEGQEFKVKKFAVKPYPTAAFTSDSAGEVVLAALGTSTIQRRNSTAGGWDDLCQLDKEQLPWLDSLTLDREGNLWMVSNRFHDFAWNRIALGQKKIFSVVKINTGSQNYMTRYSSFSGTSGRHVLLPHMETLLLLVLLLNIKLCYH